METKEIIEIPPIPAALPIAETEDERDQLFKRFDDQDAERLQAEQDAKDDDYEILDGDDDYEEPELPKPPKKKLFLAFVCVVCGFVFLVGAMSWFFGMGVFAEAKTQTVDRTAKNSSGGSSPVSEEEKLKMALNLVAEKENVGENSLLIESPDENVSDTPDFKSSVDIPSTRATDVTQPVRFPEPIVETDQVISTPTTSDNRNGKSTVENQRSPTVQTLVSRSNEKDASEQNTFSSPSGSAAEASPPGRSLFFGIDRIPTKADTKKESDRSDKTEQRLSDKKSSKATIPFGTQLPVRFPGTVYTLRSSGGMVRLELTKKVSGKNYSYPKGTVLVGELRGSEYKRAFISVIGLIDPKTGGFVKFSGEVMGTDGASGVAGRRRRVKSGWSRVLGGLRDAGEMALGSIGNITSRGGGTVIVSESTSKGSDAVSDEISGLVRNKKRSGEFIEIAAGTEAFVQVNDLPDEK